MYSLLSNPIQSFLLLMKVEILNQLGEVKIKTYISVPLYSNNLQSD